MQGGGGVGQDEFQTLLCKHAGPEPHYLQEITISQEKQRVIISVQRVYLPRVLVFLLSPWHTESYAALHKCQSLIVLSVLKSNILSL